MKKKHQYEAPALSFVEMETANMLAGSVNISDEITNDDAVMSKKAETKHLDRRLGIKSSQQHNTKAGDAP